MVPEIAALVLNGVGVLELSEEADLLEYVLPLFHGLLAEVGHLLDGDNLLAEEAPGVVDRAKAAMADLPQVLEDLLRVVLFKEVGDLRVLQAARPRHQRHNLAVSRPAQIAFASVAASTAASAPALVVARLDFQLRLSPVLLSGGGGGLLLLLLDPNLCQLAVLCQSITLLSVGRLACKFRSNALH